MGRQQQQEEALNALTRALEVEYRFILYYPKPDFYRRGGKKAVLNGDEGTD